MKDLEKILQNPLVIGAIAILLLKKSVADPLLESFGLKESSGDKEIKKQESIAAVNAFNPNFYKSVAPCPILTYEAASKLSDLIYNAMGFFNDNESQVYGVFRSLRYKSQVSYLSENFFKRYKRDLLGYLKEYFNDAEMAQVYSIVNNFPTK